MKTIAKSSFLIALVLALLTPGCKKAEKPPAVDASQLLQQAFEGAEPALKETIASAAANLKAQKFAEVTKALEPVASNPRLTEPQAQALMTTILQMNEAAADNPKLDTPEMYAIRAKMFMELRRGAR